MNVVAHAAGAGVHRRSVLAAALLPEALRCAAPSLSVVAQKHPDAGLLTACAELHAARAALAAYNAAEVDDQAQGDAVCDRWVEAVDALRPMRPTGDAGLRAKAEAVFAAMLYAEGNHWGREEYAALAVLCDVLGKPHHTSPYDQATILLDRSAYPPNCAASAGAPPSGGLVA